MCFGLATTSIYITIKTNLSVCDYIECIANINFSLLLTKNLLKRLGQVWLENCLCSAMVQMCVSFHCPLPAAPVLGPYVLMVSDVFTQNSFPLGTEIPSENKPQSLLLYLFCIPVEFRNRVFTIYI